MPLRLTVGLLCLSYLACLVQCGSEEEDLLEAAVQRCKREVTEPLISGGTYQHLGKIDGCVNDGLNALHAGSTPGDVAKKIVDCVDGNTFPDPLVPTIRDFKDCVKARLS